jgi:hypothetical protein
MLEPGYRFTRHNTKFELVYIIPYATDGEPYLCVGEKGNGKHYAEWFNSSILNNTPLSPSKSRRSPIGNKVREKNAIFRCKYEIVFVSSNKKKSYLCVSNDGDYGNQTTYFTRWFSTNDLKQ